ncbi:bifunctional 3,4-dihydroxy-2-butanone-4-phosphate synthase/GTP cyclohydrolase II [Salininema proteolyticum]|uniref:Riboflavin biosynthesis protein RibBA n=1 Tax=Salininema proteolyticum TaxID=1607685 RepID=A0ABV8U207_9ACTN
MTDIRLNTIDEAVAALASGRPVVVADDEDRENEGDLIFAAEDATPELLAFMIRYTSGYICVPMPADRADSLDLPPGYKVYEDDKATPYAVSVDARHGVSTGISAADRAHTINLLSDPASRPGDFTRPGHVVPLRANPGGVLKREGHTEAAIDLARLAGKQSVGVLCEMVNDDGTMKRLPDLREFADEHGLALISIADLVEYRRRNERTVSREAKAVLPTDFGDFDAYGYSMTDGSAEHVALVKGDLSSGEDVLVRVHSECLTGDAFGSLRCDCGPQLHEAMRQIESAGRGVVVYLRGHEGRGIGLSHKLQAYQLQDVGRDTVDANLDLGLPADAREWSAAAAILQDLGVKSVSLLTNNPDKREGLEAGGVEVVERLPVPTFATPANMNYLQTKRDRMGHLLDLPQTVEGVA